MVMLRKYVLDIFLFDDDQVEVDIDEDDLLESIKSARDSKEHDPK